VQVDAQRIVQRREALAGRRRIRSTSRAKSASLNRVTRTSVSKSTSVMSAARAGALRNRMAARWENGRSSSMLPLVSNSRPTCRGADGASSLPRAKYVMACARPPSVISKSSASGR